MMNGWHKQKLKKPIVMTQVMLAQANFKVNSGKQKE